MKKQNPLGLVVGILIFTIGMLALTKACQENRGQTRESADTNSFLLLSPGTNDLVKFKSLLRPWTEFFPVQIYENEEVMFEITPLVTNRWTNVVRVLEEEPVSTPCPECSGPNHHDRQVARMRVHERVSASVVYRGQTNHVVVWAGVVTNWIGTNLVMRQRRQPGWTAPPMPTPPPLTNSHSTWINHDPIGRTMVSAVEGGKLALHEEWRSK